MLDQKNSAIPEEDNWRFVEASQAKTPLKPVIDDEPIYEDIPQTPKAEIIRVGGKSGPRSCAL